MVVEGIGDDGDIDPEAGCEPGLRVGGGFDTPPETDMLTCKERS